MDGFELSAEQQQELKAALKSARNQNKAKAGVKINALLLLGTGWTLQETGTALFLNADTLSNYVNRYKSDGLDKVLSTAYKGSQPLLTEEQLVQLEQELTSHIYLTTNEVCSYVEVTFGVRYTISGMTDLLNRLGFSYKKPALKPGKADLERQEEFLKLFSEFMENKAENEAVFFMDAVHPIHNSMPAYGWMKKGETTELKSNSGRERLNIHGAMNAETFEVIPLISESSVNTELTIQLLEYLEKIYPLAAVIHVILDNAKYHYSKEVQKWLENSRINLVFLPPYSPELNLIERLWRVFKKNVLYNKYYETFKEFKNASTNFFLNQEKHYDEIASIMGGGLDSINLGF